MMSSEVVRTHHYIRGFLRRYLVAIGSLEKSDGDESEKSQTFEKRYFLVKLQRKEIIGF